MQVPYEMQIGWRYVRAARGRGFVSFIAMVSVAGIALGVAALIVVLSVVNGFQKEVRDRMLDAVGHVEVYDAEPDTLARVRAAPGITAAAPFAASALLVGRGDVLRGAYLRGVDPAAEPAVTPLLTAAVLKPLVPGERALLLGATLARDLAAKPGDSVTLVLPAEPGQSTPRWLRFTLAGVVETGHYEYDSTLAVTHIADAAEALGAGATLGVRARAADAAAAPQVAESLYAVLGPRALVRDWTRVNRAWFDSVQIQKRMLSLIVVLIVAVAAFNLVSTLVMTVTDKRGDIAILRTLGASPRSIMGVFVVQGALSGLVGTAAGVALGLLIAFNVGTLVPWLESLAGVTFLPANIYLISRMPSDPQAADVLPIAAISLALAFVATLYPSWRASRLKPAEALRHD